MHYHEDDDEEPLREDPEDEPLREDPPLLRLPSASSENRMGGKSGQSNFKVDQIWHC